MLMGSPRAAVAVFAYCYALRSREFDVSEVLYVVASCPSPYT